MREQKKQNLTDPNVRKRFVTYKEAAELYSMGLTHDLLHQFPDASVCHGSRRIIQIYFLHFFTSCTLHS